MNGLSLILSIFIICFGAGIIQESIQDVVQAPGGEPDKSDPGGPVLLNMGPRTTYNLHEEINPICYDSSLGNSFDPAITLNDTALNISSVLTSGLIGDDGSRLSCNFFNQFQCKSGECIPQRYVCDADPTDCNDGSDEEICFNGIPPQMGNEIATSPSNTPSSTPDFKSFLVTLYENENFSGKNATLTVRTGRCTNFPEEWQNNVSSILTSKCMIFYSELNCFNRALRIGPNQATLGKLLRVPNNRLNSVHPCEDERRVLVKFEEFGPGTYEVKCKDVYKDGADLSEDGLTQSSMKFIVKDSWHGIEKKEEVQLRINPEKSAYKIYDTIELDCFVPKSGLVYFPAIFLNGTKLNIVAGRKKLCHRYQFQCKSRNCIGKASDVCDGVKDCNEGEDEENCSGVSGSKLHENIDGSGEVGEAQTAVVTLFDSEEYEGDSTIIELKQGTCTSFPELWLDSASSIMTSKCAIFFPSTNCNERSRRSNPSIIIGPGQVLDGRRLGVFNNDLGSAHLCIDGPLVERITKLEFEDYGPGNYEIKCLGPASRSKDLEMIKTLLVKKPEKPHFVNKSEDVVFEEGDEDRRLTCDMPEDDDDTKITWDTAYHSGVREDRSGGLVFDKITEARADGIQVTCTASNRIGSDTKTFKIHVKKRSQSHATEFSSTLIIVIVISALIIGFCVIAGLGFVYFKFLKLGAQMVTYLTNDEVKEFIHGKSNCFVSTPTSAEDADDDEQGIMVECLPYNSIFEVSKENVFVDFTKELGHGEYGIVYEGSMQIRTSGVAKLLQVAIKTVRKDVDVSYFKALMAELKILAYIGQHENIVNLVGAHSTNIKNRELYVGVELCETSLLKFLREHRSSLLLRHHHKPDVAKISSSNFGSTGYANKVLENTSIYLLTTFDLRQWAEEIVTGMEYLSYKNIVHADLAARNVLLSFDMHAKICDFGLARQLIDYNYVKTQQCPLPWKWMALESLSQMKFSTKSDVWAFGITLWEIFSLGDIPYPGMTWTLDFTELLRNGLRMEKPLAASETMYNLMSMCWKNNPRDRPTFSYLKERLHSMEMETIC